MTQQQRVGQLFVLGLAGDRLGPAETAAVMGHHLGSVWFTVTTSMGAARVRVVTDAVQRLATARATAGVRFFVAANQEGGRIQALRGPGFSTMPNAVEQGTLSAPALERDAATWGRQLIAAGVNWNFAPVMDVVPPGAEDVNQPIGMLRRQFGHDPATVGAHGVAFLRGMSRAGVVTAAKHFPGLGRVRANTDVSADVIDQASTPDDPYLQSFQQAIDARVPYVMVALASYTKIDPDHLAVFSPAVLRQLLRARMHFTGVIVSDDLGEAQAVQAIPPQDRAIDFVQAGGDQIISKTIGPAVAMDEAVLARAATDPGFDRRVTDAALRVLRTKEAAGLLPCSPN
jgi:beta-N-acetylhexosaminidase